MTADIDDYDRPLRPLTDAGHVNRYQAVDNFIDQFNAFKAVFDDVTSLQTKGYLFVVTGDRGYGKTSLRQRCAFWMLSEYSQGHSEIIVVDLSDEDWKGDALDERLRRTLNWILDEMIGPLEPDVVSRIRNSRDMADSFHALGRALRARGAATGALKPVVLVVLLPGYPQAEELERYYGLAREGMIFLAEIFDPEVIRDITEKIDRKREGFGRDGIGVHTLPLGELKAGDDELLAQWMQADLQNCPTLTNAAVLATCNRLIQDRKIGTSELMKLLIGVLRSAIAEQKSEVTAEHITRYYEDALYGRRD